MPNLMKLFCALGFTLLLSGCGEPTLDTSSKQAMEDSAKEIMAELSESDRKRFKDTVAGIYMLAGFATLGNDTNIEEVKANIDAKLHGKTADEIFQLGAEIKEKMGK